jgi:predicted component of type VI protein secretion system
VGLLQCMKLFPEIYIGTEAEDDVISDVYQSIVRLLNTRTNNTIQEFLTSKNRSILNYGIPDFTHLEMANEINRRMILSCIRKSVNDYETKFKIIEIGIKINSTGNMGLKVDLVGLVSCEIMRIHRKTNFTIEIIRT